MPLPKASLSGADNRNTDHAVAPSVKHNPSHVPVQDDEPLQLQTLLKKHPHWLPWILAAFVSMVSLTAFWVLLALRLNQRIRWNWYAVWVPALPLTVLLGAFAVTRAYSAVRSRSFLEVAIAASVLVSLAGVLLLPAAAEGYIPAFVPTAVVSGALLLGFAPLMLLMRVPSVRKQLGMVRQGAAYDRFTYLKWLVSTFSILLGYRASLLMLTLRLMQTQFPSLQGISYEYIGLPLWFSFIVVGVCFVWGLLREARTGEVFSNGSHNGLFTITFASLLHIFNFPGIVILSVLSEPRRYAHCFITAWFLSTYVVGCVIGSGLLLLALIPLGFGQACVTLGVTWSQRMRQLRSRLKELSTK